ncbi:hypothetical protein [Dactylosporangium sp. NPDC048998]|uniref:hypothetical protein n=1 Tax=Dactylosporangium sp. NPDC048998 TaxID=3363976 RepID=UPI0037132EC6
MSQPPYEQPTPNEGAPPAQAAQPTQPAQGWQHPPSAPHVLSRGAPAAQPGVQGYYGPPATAAYPQAAPANPAWYPHAALTNPAAYPQAAPASPAAGPAAAAPAPGPQAAPVSAQPGVQAAPVSTAYGPAATATVQGAGRAETHAGAVAQGAAAGQAWSAGVTLARPTGGVATTPSAPPPPGTVYRRGDVAGQPRVQRLAGLHIGAHVVNAAALEQLSAGSPGAGLLVGADRNRQPVSIRLFHRKPTSVVLVGGVWAARVLAFRALALGAQVYAVTGQPSAWDGLGAHGVGQNSRVQHATVELDRLPPATAHRPVLVVRDTPPGGTTATLSAWQARITVVHRLDYQAVEALKSADLVMFQRLEPGEAQWAAHVLRMSPMNTRLVQQLEPEMLTLVGDGEYRYVWLHQTAGERYLLGAPQR